MRIAALKNRLAVEIDGDWRDVEQLSGGRFSADPMGVFEIWDEFHAWAIEQTASDAAIVDIDATHLTNPVPHPRQVFAIGLNYDEHAAESAIAAPTEPMVFTKFPSCLTGPYADISLPNDVIDYEAELVVVIARTTERITTDEAWDSVAGVALGQDLSDRDLQMRGDRPQFSLAKSYSGFGPIGPWITTPHELNDRDAIDLGCQIKGGDALQAGNTRDMIFGVAELISYLSSIVTLYPGDVIFTGTPSGVGMGRNPVRYLTAGETLETFSTDLGTMRNRLVD